MPRGLIRGLPRETAKVADWESKGVDHWGGGVRLSFASWESKGIIGVADCD